MSKVISKEEEEYTLSLIEDLSDPYKREVGLEKLCDILNKGFLLNNPNKVADRLIARVQDDAKKVVRWALNALALLSRLTRKINPNLIVEAIEANQNYPDICCSGYAALFAVCGEERALEIIYKKGLPLDDIHIISASQYSQEMLNRMVKKKVDIDNATELTLKNVSILIGLDKAPENIFHPAYPNKDILGNLNEHDDDKVSQYSVWALLENPNFTIKHSKIRIKDINDYPENVRSWTYRLMAENSSTAEKHKEIIFDVARHDDSREAREGMAASLKNIYFPTLEEIVLIWAKAENDNEVKALLYDHMASVSSVCPCYVDPVIQRYQELGIESSGRTRLEIACQQTDLYSKLKRISVLQQHGGLLSMGDTITINANNIGAVVKDANVGDISSIIQNVNNSELKDALQNFKEFSSNLPDENKLEAKKLIEEAAKDPSKGSIEKIINFLKNTVSVSASGLTIAEHVPKIIAKFQEILSNLPL